MNKLVVVRNFVQVRQQAEQFSDYFFNIKFDFRLFVIPYFRTLDFIHSSLYIFFWFFALDVIESQKIL